MFNMSYTYSIAVLGLVVLANLSAGSRLEATKIVKGSRLDTNLSTVHFLLHTIQNPVEYDELFVGDKEALENSHFHSGGPVWLLVHGFGFDTTGSFPYETGLDLLATNENGNVILLDWAFLASGTDYPKAVEDAFAIANYTAELFEFLFEEQVTTVAETHLVGFSLGGQIVSLTAKQLEWRTGGKVSRITGLDPARPLFEDVPEDDKLSPDDAYFVDVIHSNDGNAGSNQPQGHVDFYPNGGAIQPGCGVDPIGRCSHERAFEYFRESITSATAFCSCKCQSWEEYEAGNCACTETANLGYYVDQTARDLHYLRTNDASPFGQGACSYFWQKNVVK